MTPSLETPEIKSPSRKRKLYAFGLILGLFLVFFLVNLDRWFLLREVFHSFDNELSRRLHSISALSAELVENYGLTSLSDLSSDPLKLLLVDSQLRKIKQQNQLDAIYIIDPSLNIVADARMSASFSQKRNYLRTDSLAISQALHGIAATSRLHHIATEYFKNGYAPLRNEQGKIIGLLVTEASASYFTTLKSYKQTFWLSLLASVALFILFSVFVWQSFQKLLKTEESLRQSEHLAFLGKMAAIMAHEIRNPLGIIRGTADVLRSKYKQSDQEELFDYIPSEVNRLNTLIGNFLTYARGPKLQRQPLNVQEFIRDQLRQLSVSGAEKDIRFETSFQNQDVVIQADPNALKQVLLNIFQNAIQASQKGSTIHIQQNTFRKKGKNWLEISIEDHGCGIEGDPERIFEPFYTTKSTGTGLGMPISKKIIESHGGKISVESEPGKGTRVRLFLPIEP
ncbi:MAG: hypothetical protein GXO76_13385 [Calditrichaeota bacterium]|nr:hypothetical protein [Calditrichota bacterium]